MSAHVYEESVIQSNATRAFLIGYLLGIIHEINDPAANKRLEEIYPLIDKEFYSHFKRDQPDEPETN
ncbi:MAG TPA: hypothetical protein VFO40_15580 [Chthoniobacterales bacterium]|nr:hypothetical protein [Chthoniobacterales bacterium]